MGRVADPGMGFEAPLVLCDATTAEPDFHLLFLDHDLDGFADMPMRGTISNRVNINKTVGTDATCQAASAYGQRACLQGRRVCRSSRSKRTLGFSLVVPWIRSSATSTIHPAR